MRDYATDPEPPIPSILKEDMKSFQAQYSEYRKQVSQGSLGKTGQFWSIYLDLMRMQHLTHLAIQENDFFVRLAGWQYFIPFYFALNKTNYARYGSYYLQTMEQIESLYPGLKEMLQYKGLSVQAQEKYSLRTAIDQRGEQTINRDAKVTGGIKNFATRENSVLKWCLNRSAQASNTKALKDLCGLEADPGIYKPVRPSQIIKSEQMVNSVIKVLTEDYVNPFGVDVDKENLVCLSSAVPVDEDVADSLLLVPEKGKQQHDAFIKTRLHKREVPLHDPIKRNNIKGFRSSTNRKVKEKNAAEVNRDILARLLYLSSKASKVIDFEKALTYPLSDVPLSLCNADGSMRKTSKSKLANKILSQSNEQTHAVEKEHTVYIVDLMALVRVISEIPETFEDLALKVISTIPKGYRRIDIVADCYWENSIKDAERAKRGTATKIILRSANAKVPREFTKFLSCGENKTRMIELFFQVWTKKKVHCLNLLRTTQIILSREQECLSLTLLAATSCDYPDLLSNHEEADTKVIAHSSHALQVILQYINLH